MDFLPTEPLRSILEKAYIRYNLRDFIQDDPISIPHTYTQREDIEISGFFTALLAWGNRKSIINSAQKLMQLMDNSPFSYICNASKNDKKPILKFVHRTFNGQDALYLMDSLKRLYLEEEGMEAIFNESNDGLKGINHLRKKLLAGDTAGRTAKHIANPDAGSAAKRLNMFLRWMVRKDENGVDFGIWKSVAPATLYIPLDVHSGTTARTLGLLKRKQNDAKAVRELTSALRTFDPADPVKYDYALFGMGVNRENNLFL